MQVGVFLSKELMNIAARSLKANITTLGPLVLPWTEQARFLANSFGRKVSFLQSIIAGGARQCLCRSSLPADADVCCTMRPIGPWETTHRTESSGTHRCK